MRMPSWFIVADSSARMPGGCPALPGTLPGTLPGVLSEALPEALPGVLSEALPEALKGGVR